jgi:hypothetical protein
MLAIIRQSPTWYFHNPPSLWPFRTSPMLRGSSNAASRSCRNATIRRATGLSSRASSFAASSASATCQAKIAHRLVQRHGPGPASADIREPPFRDRQILQVRQIFRHRLAHAVFLAAPAGLRHGLQPAFDLVRELHCQHGCLLPLGDHMAFARHANRMLRIVAAAFGARDAHAAHTRDAG